MTSDVASVTGFRIASGFRVVVRMGGFLRHRGSRMLVGSITNTIGNTTKAEGCEARGWASGGSGMRRRQVNGIAKRSDSSIQHALPYCDESLVRIGSPTFGSSSAHPKLPGTSQPYSVSSRPRSPPQTLPTQMR